MEPWRNVTHIAEGIGPHGGRHWILTLSCGHPVIHRQPRPRLGVLLTQGPALAPQRKRCILCPTGGPDDRRATHPAVPGRSPLNPVRPWPMIAP